MLVILPLTNSDHAISVLLGIARARPHAGLRSRLDAPSENARVRVVVDNPSERVLREAHWTGRQATGSLGSFVPPAFRIAQNPRVCQTPQFRNRVCRHTVSIGNQPL